MFTINLEDVVYFLGTIIYSHPGYYFITICAREKRCIFGQIVGCGILDAPLVQLSDIRKLTEEALIFLDHNSEKIRLDKYVIMPNHLHLIVKIEGSTDISPGASGKPRPTNAMLPKFISSLKRFTNHKSGRSLWQTSYYDHIIRNEADYLRIWEYIDTNPAKWAEDEYYQK